jgi:hypothetical protein
MHKGVQTTPRHFHKMKNVLAIFPENNILIQEDIPKFSNLSD